MSAFVTSLIIAPQEDGVHWKLWLPFKYHDDVLGMYTVPTGFETDGGSIPRLFTNIISPTGKGFRAFVVHDWLYAIQKTTKDEADQCLLRALRVCNFNHIAEDVIFEAVQQAGQTAWDEDAKNVLENRALEVL